MNDEDESVDLDERLVRSENHNLAWSTSVGYHSSMRLQSHGVSYKHYQNQMEIELGVSWTEESLVYAVNCSRISRRVGGSETRNWMLNKCFNPSRIIFTWSVLSTGMCKCLNVHWLTEERIAKNVVWDKVRIGADTFHPIDAHWVNVRCLLEKIDHQVQFEVTWLRRTNKTERKFRHFGQINDRWKGLNELPRKQFHC